MQELVSRMGATWLRRCIATVVAAVPMVSWAEDVCRRTLAIVVDGSAAPTTVDLVVQAARPVVVPIPVHIPLLDAPALLLLAMLIAVTAWVARRRYPGRSRLVLAFLISVVALSGVTGSNLPRAAVDTIVSIFQVDPAKLAFEPVAVGDRSVVQQVTLRNEGALVADVAGVTVPEPFGQSSNCTRLEAGAACHIDVWSTFKVGDVCVDVAAPVLTLVAPARVARGSIDTLVQLQGSRFQMGAVVLLADTIVKPDTMTDSIITFTLPNALTAAVGQRQIKVRNPDNLTSNALSWLVFVPNEAPSVRFVAPTDGAEFALGQVIDVDVVASDTDGKVTKIDLFDGKTLLASSSADALKWAWKDAGAGGHALIATARDDSGQETSSDPVTLNIVDAGSISVLITSPEASASFFEPASISIVAVPSVVGSSVESVVFSANGKVLGSATTSPFKWEWTGIPAGSYALLATVTDDHGRSAQSAPVMVTVASDPDAPAIVIIAPVDGATVDADKIAVVGTTRRIKSVAFPGECRAVDFADQKFTIQDVPLVYGDNELIVTGIAEDGRRVERMAVVHNTRPQLFVDAPASLFSTALASVNVSGHFLGPTDSRIRLSRSGSTEVIWPEMSGMRFDALAALARGTNDFVATLTTPAGQSTSAPLRIVRGSALKLAITVPTNLQIVEATEIVVRGTYDAPVGGTISVNGVFATLSAGTFTALIPIDSSSNDIVATLNTPDAGLAQAWAKISNIYPRAGPINTPVAGSSVHTGLTLVEGVVLTSTGSLISINGVPAEVIDRRLDYGVGGTYYYMRVRGTVDVVDGDNLLTLMVTSPAGSIARKSIHVKGGEVDERPKVAITKPISGSVLTTDLSVTVSASSADSRISHVEMLNGATMYASHDLDAIEVNEQFGLPSTAPGTYTLTARAIDVRGGVTLSAPVVVRRPFTPTVSIASPVNQARYKKGQSVPVKIDAAVEGGTITNVILTDNAGLVKANIPAPYEFDWTGVGIGPHPLIAKATSDAGITVASAQVLVVVDPAVNQAPTVSITAPADGSTFAETGSINISATAMDSDGPVVKVEFLDDDRLLGADLTPPYGYQWDAPGLGAHVLTAKATDNAGATTTSLPVTILVTGVPNALPTIKLLSPVSGELFSYDESVILEAEAEDPDGTIGRVIFFDEPNVLAVVTAPPYRYEWKNVPPGRHRLTAVTFDSRLESAITREVVIDVNPEPKLVINWPPNGAVVQEDFISIAGSVVASRNSGVTVNEEVAIYDRESRFIASNVPLLAGPNVLDVVLTTDDGKAVRQQIVVTSTGPSKFISITTPSRGLAPFTTTLQITKQADVDAASADFDVDDDGFTDESRAFEDGVASLTITFPYAGSYVVGIQVSGASRTPLYQTKHLVHATTEPDQNSLLQEVWAHLNAGLASGKLDKALVQLNQPAREKYGDVFESLVPNMQEIVASYSDLLPIGVEETLAEFAVNRMIDGIDRVFLIYLLQDGSGIWKLDSM